MTLLHTDCLIGRLQFDAVEVQVIRSNLLQSIGCSHKDSGALQLSVTGYLKVILLLTHKGIIGVGEIESFIRIHAVMGNRSGKERIER